MPGLPSNEAIEAKAAELGVDLAERGARARVASAIMAGEQPAPEPEPVLLSRTVSQLDGGVVVVDVHWIPKENRDGREDEAEPDAGRG